LLLASSATLVCGAAHAQQVVSMAGDAAVLSAGSDAGVRKGMTGRFCAPEEVGGQIKQVCSASFKIESVLAKQSVARVTKGVKQDVHAGVLAEFDAKLLPKKVRKNPGEKPPSPPVPPPAADIGELKRVAKEKLADGNTDDVIHDLLYNVPPEKLDAEAIDLLAQAYERQGKFTEAARVRASGPDAPKAALAIPAPSPAAAAGTVPAPTPAPGAVRPGAPAGAAGVPSMTPADYLALGRAAFSRGDALNAQSAANRILEIDPQSSDAYRLLGNAYALRGERAIAKANLEQSLLKNEKNEGTLLDLYELSMGDKNWDGALDALRRATEVNPENGAKLVALGRKARADGDPVHARQVFAAAAVASPKDVSVLTEYASILLQAKDLDAALEPLMKAAAVEPDREIVRANLASTLRRKGLWKDAEKEYREAIRADPDYAPALRGLGTLLLERGQAAQAIELLKKAVLRDPTNVEAAWALARAQRQTGALKDAAESLAASAALDKAPLDDEAGAVAYERGRYEEAVGFFNRALAKEPGSAVFKANREKAAAAAAFLKRSGLTVPEK
jgi:tetratricopeptide (TPR) repeat protein